MIKRLKKYFGQFKGQFGQDRWIIEDVFKGSRHRFFLDAGAFDGVAASNTHILEKKFGWHGICIEPGSHFNKLIKNRKCIRVKACILDKKKTVNFNESGIESGIPQYYSKHKANFSNKNIVTKKTVPLEEILKKYHVPKIIDYLSLDTEGTEYAILKNFPFDKYSFLAMTIEHNNRRNLRDNLRKLLLSKGYILFANIACDDWWLHKTIAPSLPISSKKHSLAYLKIIQKLT